MGIPKEFGGLGPRAVDVATVIEELAAADPGVALIFGGSGLFQTPSCGRETPVRRPLPRAVHQRRAGARL
jgi:alkylation response protein AidB-like acyl-CoA dehydrogenase